MLLPSCSKRWIYTDTRLKYYSLDFSSTNTFCFVWPALQRNILSRLICHLVCDSPWRRSIHMSWFLLIRGRTSHRIVQMCHQRGNQLGAPSKLVALRQKQESYIRGAKIRKIMCNRVSPLIYRVRDSSKIPWVVCVFLNDHNHCKYTNYLLIWEGSPKSCDADRSTRISELERKKT